MVSMKDSKIEIKINPSSDWTAVLSVCAIIFIIMLGNIWLPDYRAYEVEEQKYQAYLEAQNQAYIDAVSECGRLEMDCRTRPPESRIKHMECRLLATSEIKIIPIPEIDTKASTWKRDPNSDYWNQGACDYFCYTHIFERSPTEPRSLVDSQGVWRNADCEIIYGEWEVAL